MISRLKDIIRNNRVFGNLYLKMAIWIKGKVSRESFYFVITRFCKVQKNKIVFCSFEGKGFSDNPKYVALELLKQKKYDLVWLVKDINDSSIPEGIRKVLYGSFNGVYELATAKVWVDNARKGWATIKKPSQYYIHTGHGGVPLKRVEADAPIESVGLGYQMMARHDSKYINLILSNSRIRTDICKNSYWYDGEVAEWGSPKIEALKTKDLTIENKVREYFGINKYLRLAIYAPTFRSNNLDDLKFLRLNYAKLVNALECKYGGRWVILVRLHPNIAEAARNLCISADEMINATFYPDMQELMTSVEMMITDYSGTMFEMMQINKPVFLFVPDLNKYNRGFYFRIEDLPFSIAKNEEELCEAIKNFDMELYLNRIKRFEREIGLVNNQNAAIRCAERIESVVENRFL